MVVPLCAATREISVVFLTSNTWPTPPNYATDFGTESPTSALHVSAVLFSSIALRRFRLAPARALTISGAHCGVVLTYNAWIEHPNRAPAPAPASATEQPLNPVVSTASALTQPDSRTLDPSHKLASAFGHFVTG